MRLVDGGKCGVAGVVDWEHVPVRTEVFSENRIVWLADLSVLSEGMGQHELIKTVEVVGDVQQI